jgi:hypothetical protein
MCMSIITVRVSLELKGRMKRCKTLTGAMLQEKRLKKRHVEKKCNALQKQSKTFD